MTAEQSQPHIKYLILSGWLALLGLLTALLYILRSNPYTMVVFLVGGQGLILLAVASFGYAAWWEIRSRLQSVVEKKFKAGEIVFRQGDYADRLYVIGKGEVEVIRENPEEGDVLLARLGPEQFFGEMGILGNAPRSATIRAATDLEVLSIHRSYFASLFSYLPMLRERVVATYRARLAADG